MTSPGEGSGFSPIIEDMIPLWWAAVQIKSAVLGKAPDTKEEMLRTGSPPCFMKFERSYGSVLQRGGLRLRTPTEFVQLILSRSLTTVKREG